MSRLYKSNMVVLGEPLEIKDVPIPGPAKPDRGENGVRDSLYREILSRAEQQEKHILDRARKEAEVIIQEAKRERAEILQTAYKEGYQKGYSDGFEKGKNEGLAQVEGALQEATQLKKSAAELKNRALRDAEEKIVELVMGIARKVLGEHVRADREAVVGIVKKALEKCPFTSRVIMRVAPEDYEVVVSSKNRLLVDMEGISELEVFMENSLPPGSCILETDSGYIDSSIQVQLDRIEKSFKELLNYEKSGA